MFQMTNICLWLVAFVIAWECIFGISHLRRANKISFPPWSNFEAAVYEGFTRLAWSVALGWVVIACVKGPFIYDVRSGWGEEGTPKADKITDKLLECDSDMSPVH